MKIRWAQVEYQPNLQHPVAPIRLGVIVEAIHGRRREVVLIGRAPKGPMPEFQVEDAWGPFRELVTNWFETVWKSAVGLMHEVEGNAFAVDRLATMWASNLYLKEPQTSSVAVTANLLTVARYRYQSFVGQRVPPFKGERPRIKPVRSWMNYTMQATG